MSHFDLITLENWCTALKNGEVVAAPAEGVYGYCADPFNPKALKKLLELKKRDAAKGLIVLVENTPQLAKLCAPLEDSMLYKLYDIWGKKDAEPSTVLLPAKEDLAPEITGDHNTVAVRLPDCDYMKEYLMAWGQPLVSTSLNESGQPPATKAEDIPQGTVALTLPAPLSGHPSKIYDVLNNKWLR